MNKRHKNFTIYVMESLQNPKLARAYLNEALADEDQRVFLIALKNVLEAQGGDMSSLAEEVQLSRQNLYRMFSQKGNPRWDNLKVVLHSLGLELEVKSYKPR